MPYSKTGKLYYTSQQLELAKNASALEYALSHGYQLEREGNAFRHPEHSSMVFTGDGRWYWNSQGESGRAIEFMTKYEQRDFIEAICILAGEDIGQTKVRTFAPAPKAQEEQKPFELPEKNSTHHRAFSYLTKTRALDPTIIRKLLKLNLIYESEDYHNAVFVERNVKGEIKGAFLRGTNTYHSKPFMGLATGSDKDNAMFYFGNTETPRFACVCESAIDAISLASIIHNSKDPVLKNTLSETVFLSTGGAGHQNVLQYIGAHQETLVNIELCQDNDEAGNQLAHAMQKDIEKLNLESKVYRILPIGKDFNEDLVRRQQLMMETEPIVDYEQEVLL